MSSLDFLYYSIGAGFLLLVVALIYLIFHLIKTLEIVRFMIEDTQDLTSDLVEIKDHFKVAILGLLGGSKLISLVKRR